MNILGAVSGHAEPQVKAYCMYMHFYLGLSKAKLAVLFRKAPSCIADWIAAYKRGNDMSRKVKEVTHRKFGIERHKWLVDLYKRKPVLLLDEAKRHFETQFGGSISAQHISVILRESGLSWKSA
ncbi:hypothetical protein HDU80_004951 [Chytriomyces hyalinus]|nr:hypothetical protein HDU80_004951 [Chytriomyces hyalinus]